MKVVPIRERPSLNDIVGRLRLLADEIESGEVEASGLFVIIPEENNYPSIYGFGDVEGNNHPMVQFQLAIQKFINNIMVR